MPVIITLIIYMLLLLLSLLLILLLEKNFPSSFRIDSKPCVRFLGHLSGSHVSRPRKILEP